MTTNTVNTVPPSLADGLWAVGILGFEAKGTPEGFFFPIEGNRRIFLGNGDMSDEQFDTLFGGVGPITEELDEDERASLEAYNASVEGRKDLKLKPGLTWGDVYAGLDRSGFMPEKDFEWVGGAYPPRGEMWLCPHGAQCYDDYLEDTGSLQEILEEALRRLK